VLAELYPEGNVGVSDVCVMGLNQNKGQKILLRLRTDDLQGFRKILSIRKVLYHELAHNVYSEHDDNFFQLMRQIENECQSRGYALSSTSTTSLSNDVSLFSGGSGMAGTDPTLEKNMSLRELTARAALLRLTKEEEEIEYHCGCRKKN